MIYVVCHDHSQFIDWCHENDKDPRAKNIVAMATSNQWAATRGKPYHPEEDSVVLYGTWADGKYVTDIVAVLGSIGVPLEEVGL